MLKERFILASGRIREIPEEKSMAAPAFQGFFQTLARLILKILALSEAGDRDRKAALAGELFRETGPGAYDKSFACPSFACRNLGEDLGRPLSVLYYEIYGTILPALLGSREEILIRMELFLEIYQAFMIEFRETGGVPEGRYITGRIRDYLSDYFLEETERRLRELSPGEDGSGSGEFLPSFSCLQAALSPASPSLPGGEEETEGNAGAMTGAMASATAEEYAEFLKAMGLEEGESPTCGLGVAMGPGSCKALGDALERRGIRVLPYTGRRSLFDLREDLAAPAFPRTDPRFYIDHREDLGLFLDESLRTRILQALEGALREEGKALSSFGGWILPVEERREDLPPDPKAVRLGRHQKKLLSGLLEREEEMIREAGLFLSRKDVHRVPWGKV